MNFSRLFWHFYSMHSKLSITPAPYSFEWYRNLLVSWVFVCVSSFSTFLYLFTQWFFVWLFFLHKIKFFSFSHSFLLPILVCLFNFSTHVTLFSVTQLSLNRFNIMFKWRYHGYLNAYPEVLSNCQWRKSIPRSIRCASFRSSHSQTLSLSFHFQAFYMFCMLV